MQLSYVSLEKILKTIIYGSRDFFNVRAIRLVDKALHDCGWTEEITEIVQGGFRGTDEATQKVCKDRWPIKTYIAYFGKHGKGAVKVRNREMLEYADALIAIWDGKDVETKALIGEATERGRRIFVSDVGSRA